MLRQIGLSTITRVLILIWLANLSSEGYCRKAVSTLGLHCNLTTPEQDVNGTRDVTRQISAINRCPEKYVNEDIIKKCENLIDSKIPGSEELFKPVVNKDRNITYWNKYCATCDDEKNTETWPSWNYSTTRQWAMKMTCMIYGVRELFHKEEHPVEFSQKFFKEHVMLKSNYFHESTFQLQCLMEEDLPLNLINFISPCITNSFRINLRTRLNSCQYIKNDGAICPKIRFFIEGLDFTFDEKGRIHMIDTSSDKVVTIEEKYVLQSGIDNIIYFCQSHEKAYKIMFLVGVGAIIVSVIFMFIYLIINFNEEYFQSFPNRILYSYSIGLTITYVLNIFIFLIFYESCIRDVLNQFSLFFNFSWTLILNWEFCRLTYFTLKKRKISVNPQPKRFLIYCFLGFVLPAFLPVIYFSLILFELRCPPVPGYFAVPCKALKDSMAECFWNQAVNVYKWGFLYLIPALFLLQACILTYITKYGSNRVRSTAHRSNFVVLIKMAYITGAIWVLFDICLELGCLPATRYIESVYDVLDGLQGVILFFSFGAHKKRVVKVWRKVQRRSKTTETFPTVSYSAG